MTDPVVPIALVIIGIIVAIDLSSIEEVLKTILEKMNKK